MGNIKLLYVYYKAVLGKEILKMAKISVLECAVLAPQNEQSFVFKCKNISLVGEKNAEKTSTGKAQ